MSGRGSGTIWNKRCHYCNEQVQAISEQESPKGHECGDLLFCSDCWKKFPSHIQRRCTEEIVKGRK